MKHLLLLTTLAVILASGCSLLQEHKTKICGTADAVCTAATSLCEVYSCNETVTGVIDDVCASAAALCAVLPGGSERDIAVARAIYNVDVERLAGLTYNKPSLEKAINANQQTAVANWLSADMQFRQYAYSK